MFLQRCGFISRWKIRHPAPQISRKEGSCMDGVAWRGGGDAYVSRTRRRVGNDSPGDWKPGGRIGEEREKNRIPSLCEAKKTQNRGADSFLHPDPGGSAYPVLRCEIRGGGGGDLFIQVDSSGALWMIKECVCALVCSSTLSVPIRIKGRGL